MESKLASVRQRQIEVATRMVNLNSEWQPDWKYLIYDNIGQNIIAPLLSMDELKNNNVVHHFSIHTNREPIPDVSAVYFVMPTDENIQRICQDLTDHLYDSYYLNFISPITRPKLEIIANAALEADCASDVKKVYDQYLNFIALEDDLFILREKDRQRISYNALNRTDASDEEINNIIDIIVGCLFSFLVTMDTIPIIRCPKGGPAEIVAERLTKQIRETLRDGRNNLFNQDSSLELSLHRPLLCLVDRSIDMSTPLHHTWTYQALVHDLLNIELNRLQIKDDSQKVQFFDLSPENDKFWRQHKGTPFPQVAEAVQFELDDYKKTENELTAGLNDPGDELSKISDAVKSLPELRENKSKIEKHTTIATAILEQIKARKLDDFFELEEKIMSRSLVDQVSLDEMLSNAEYGEAKDKYRLFLISYICDNPTMSDSEADKYMSLLEGFGCNRAAFDYVRSWKTFSRTNVVNLQSKLESSGGLLKTANMFSKLMTQGSKFVMEGVKNLVLKEHTLPLTKIVDNLMDCRTKSSREALEYVYLDPMSQVDDASRREKLFQSAIVFVVGGGNYIEYQNLVEYSNSKSRAATGIWGARKVIYGATDLLNGYGFLQELEQIGSAC